MATGISGNVTAQCSTYIQAKIEYSESYSVANNTSDVTATLYYRRTNSYSYDTYAYGDYQVLINGTYYTVYAGTFTIPANNISWLQVGSKKVTGIAHASNGSKSITIGGRFAYSGGSVMDFSTSQTIALTTIPRASTASVSPNPLTLSAVSNTLTVSTNRKSSSFTHTLLVTCGSWTSTQTGVGASTTFAIPKTVMQFMTADTMTCTVRTTTYNGSTQVGSATTTSFQVQVDHTSEYVSIDSYTATDTNTTTAAVTGGTAFIKDASNLRLTLNLSATGDYTTLAQATVTYDGTATTYPLSGSSATVDFTKAKTGSTDVTVVVTDNRGYAQTFSIYLTIINYEAPSFASLSALRTNAGGDSSATGTYISYETVIKCFAGSFGSQTNAVTMSYQYKLPNAAAWTDGVNTQTHSYTGAGSITSDTFTGITDASEVFSSSSEYDFRLVASDIFSTVTSPTLRIHQGLPVIGWGQTHVDIYGSFSVHSRADETLALDYGVSAEDEKSSVMLSAYGYITSSGTKAVIYVPMNMLPAGSEIEITRLACGMRMIKWESGALAGGYLGGSNGTDLSSQIESFAPILEQGVLRIVLAVDSGTYGINNTPLSGEVTISYSVPQQS